MLRTLQGNFDLHHEIKEITNLHRGIADKLKSSVEDAIEIGRLLTEVKNHLKHGDFLPWLKVNLPFSEWTARNYMKLYAYRDKTGTLPDLQAAYRQIETLEAQEKQSEAKKQRERIIHYQKTGEKPDGWKRGTDDKAAERLKQEEKERAGRVEEAKQRLAEEEERRQRDAVYEEPTINPDDLIREARRVVEEQKRHAHLNLSCYPDNMNQTAMFTAIEHYLNLFEDDSGKLEAAHNLLKKLKDIISGLQQKSVRSS